MTDQEHAEQIRSTMSTLIQQLNEAAAASLDVKIDIGPKASVRHPKHGMISRDWDAVVTITRTGIL
jgi:hypothetical protein